MRASSRFAVAAALAAGLALGLAGGTACSPAEEPAAEAAEGEIYDAEERGLMSAEERELAKRVERAVHEATGVKTLEATARADAVALYGGVGTPGVREEAEAAARGVEGVRRVRNKIAVREPPQPMQ